MKTGIEPRPSSHPSPVADKCSALQNCRLLGSKRYVSYRDGTWHASALRWECSWLEHDRECECAEIGEIHKLTRSLNVFQLSRKQRILRKACIGGRGGEETASLFSVAIVRLGCQPETYSAASDGNLTIYYLNPAQSRTLLQLKLVGILVIGLEN
jgi:hypothetical protein